MSTRGQTPIFLGFPTNLWMKKSKSPKPAAIVISEEKLQMANKQPVLYG